MHELNMLHTQQDKCMKNQSYRMTAEKKQDKKCQKKKKKTTLVNSGWNKQKGILQSKR